MKSAILKRKHITDSAVSIFTPLNVNDEKYLSDTELSYLLKIRLLGVSTAGLPNRTRSKFVKTEICQALGYLLPKSFKKTQPRFLGQNFDCYIQKSLNLQIWNEDISNERRYVIIQVSENDIIKNLKIIKGEDLLKLDTTGTLTQKYQARLSKLDKPTNIFSNSDPFLFKKLKPKKTNIQSCLPTSLPTKDNLINLSELHNRLLPLINFEFENLQKDQDRNRGAALHREVCRLLGYEKYADNGRFPDLLNQLLEVKLQTSPTIDLGLILPTSEKIFIKTDEFSVRYCDVRYLIAAAEVRNTKVIITNFAIGYGIDFFSQFKQFLGKGLNKKIQIPLPKNFFND